MTSKTSDFGPLAAVECLAADGGKWTLVFVKEFKHPIETVWNALTDPAQLEQWAPFDASRNLAELGSATITMVDVVSGQRDDMPTEVRVLEPPTLLEYTWGTDLLRWELASRAAGGTTLTLRHTVDTKQLVVDVAAGWHLCLGVADHLLDGDPVPRIAGENAKEAGWKVLDDLYAEQLGL